MDVIKINPFPSVAASTPAVLATDQLKGYSLHGLVFVQGGTAFTKAHMTDIRIGANGKNFIDNISVSQLQDMNDYDGLADTANHVFWWFGDPTARTIRGQHLGDLDLSVHKGPLEIDVAIGAATAPTLQVYAIIGPPKAQMGLGFTDSEVVAVRSLIRSVIQNSAAVTRKAEGIGLGSGAGARIRKLAFFHTNLTSVEFKKQGITKHEDLSDALNDAIQLEFGRVPQAALYVVDRIVDGNQGEADDTLRPDGSPWNLQVLITTSAAETSTVFADVITAPQLL